MESFNQRCKTSIRQIPLKKRCCRETSSFFHTDMPSDNYGVALMQYYVSCKEECCRITFIRELFLAYGTVTDPDKRYHLDFSFATSDIRDRVAEILSYSGFFFHTSTRRGLPILYTKNSGEIEDFLTYIGASQGALAVMNAKIVKDFRSSVNRQVNCDTANIEKQLSASQKELEAIDILERIGALSKFPEALQTTARIRRENPQLSLSELADLMGMSKSGMKHRMEKLVAAADDFADGQMEEKV